MNNTAYKEHNELTEPVDVNHQRSRHTPRNPVFAALMSTILPGFGQLYNGQINKSLWTFTAFCIVSVPVSIIIALFLPVWLTTPLIALATLLCVLIWLYGIIDAWYNARKQGNYQLRPWQTNGLYTVVFLICSMLILPSILFWVRDNLVQAFHAPSGSMTPTVLKGDLFFANKNYNCPYCRTSVARGDVAIFVYPNNRNHYYIKRIIGLAGDKIQVSDQGVFVNGELLGKKSADGKTTETIDNRTWEVIWDSEIELPDFEITVAPGHAFVLGDNRSKSNDSRKFGLVPLSDVVGRSRQVWFSKGPDGIRWSRMGKALQPSGVQK